MQRQTDKVIKIWLASFLWDAWVKCKTVSNPKSPKKHDTVYHFDLSQMVLELINLRQSFPNNLIIRETTREGEREREGDRKWETYTWLTAREFSNFCTSACSVVFSSVSSALSLFDSKTFVVSLLISSFCSSLVSRTKYKRSNIDYYTSYYFSVKEIGGK